MEGLTFSPAGFDATVRLLCGETRSDLQPTRLLGPDNDFLRSPKKNSLIGFWGGFRSLLSLISLGTNFVRSERIFVRPARLARGATPSPTVRPARKVERKLRSERYKPLQNLIDPVVERISQGGTKVGRHGPRRAFGERRIERSDQRAGARRKAYGVRGLGRWFYELERWRV